MSTSVVAALIKCRSNEKKRDATNFDLMINLDLMINFDIF